MAIIYLLIFIIFNDYLSCITYSITGYVFLSKFLLYVSEGLLFLIPLLVGIKYKILFYRKFQLYYLFIFLVLIYFFQSVIHTGISFVSLKIIRLLFLPLYLFILGTYLRFKKIPVEKIIKIYIYLALLISTYGIIELFILNEFSGYHNFLGISNYFSDIKNHKMAAGITTGTRLAQIGLKYRMTSLFLEPLSTGYMLSGAISLLIYLIYSKNKIFDKKISFSFLLIIVLGLFFTQTRSAILFLIITLIPISLKNFKIFIFNLIMASTILIFLLLNLNEFILGILLSRTEHQAGVFDFFHSLFDPGYFLGKGFGSVTIDESGYALYYSQFGYMGLFLFYSVIISYYYRLKKYSTNIINIYSSGLILGILVINFFHHYHTNVKGFGFIWLIIGFSVIYSSSKVKTFYTLAHESN